MEASLNYFTQIVIYILVPLALYIPAAIAIFILGILNRRQSKRSRLPFDIAKSQRMPGQSLLEQYRDKSTDVIINLMFLMFFSAWPFAYRDLAELTGQKPPNLYVLLLVALIACGVFTYRLVKHRKTHRDLRLGLEAEWFTAMELYNNLPDSYVIFNDIQADKFNIDHLVVGPNGVFAIETKGRRKPNLKNTKKQKGKINKEHVVQVDGAYLKFPTYSENDTTQQASRQAKWAEKWLTQATGLTVPVFPVVNIPGWYVEITTKPHMLVASTRNLAQQLSKAGRFMFDANQVNAIAYQIKQKALREHDLL